MSTYQFPSPFDPEVRAAKLRDIQETLKADGAVIIATYLRATQYTKKHLNWFRVKSNGLEVRHGKGYVNIDHCALRFGRRA